MRYLPLAALILAAPALAQQLAPTPPATPPTSTAPPQPTLQQQVEQIKKEITDDAAPATSAARSRLAVNLVHVGDALLDQAAAISALRQQVAGLLETRDRMIKIDAERVPTPVVSAEAPTTMEAKP